MDAHSFRNDFPEFNNCGTYSDAQINFWLNIATESLNECVWGSLYPYGIELYVAHNLALSARSQQIAARGGAAGSGGSGLVSSKTLDKASISYDTKSGTLANAGAWNLTDYGVRFYQLAQQFGAGGLQVTGGCGYGSSYNPDTIYPYWIA